ncbi:MAG: Gfo/Idh/MocA family oxidoreductase [Actinobacteria bacterium]|nr:Gfo/Idh/MocA family oxidoreductase [Actinomycetota bacterium]
MMKMGIVGMGKMAQAHAQWILDNREMSLIAICEKNKSRHKEIEAQYKVPVFSDIDQFLKIKDMDMVVIVTTNEVHEQLTIKSLNSGRDVIVEKPMSVNYESTHRMIKAAEKNKKQIYVHHSSRWDRDFLLIKEVISSGLLGEILVLKAFVLFCDEGWPSWGIEGMANPWRVKKEFYGGMLFDWGPHLVDQTLQIMGRDPVSVFGILQNAVWSSEVDDHFLAILNFKGNVYHQLECSNNSRITLPRWHIIGTKGTLKVKGKNEPFWDEIEINYIRNDGNNEIENLKLVGIKESGLEGGFYKDLIQHMKGGKKNFVTMYEASEVVRILDLIKQSSEKGEVLKV